MRKLRVADTDLSRNGTVARKPVKAELWTKHAVDQDAGRVGRRYSKRHAGSLAQYGIANSFDDMDHLDFLYGNGTYCEGQGKHAAIRDAIGERVVGYLPITEAIAYRIAAKRRGIVLEVIYEV